MGEMVGFGRRPRDVTAIVEEQVKRWQVSAVHESTEHPWPVVTISREFGTLGVELGHRVANQLGFTCWDRELVSAIARDLHTDEASVEVLDERRRGVVEDLLAATLFGQDATSEDYADELRRIVTVIGKRGGAVIIGRGAQFILPSDTTLRVRLIAPLEVRARHVAERTNVPVEVALRGVRAGDRERADFIRKNFHKDVTDLGHYDLVINTEAFSLERSAVMIRLAYLAKFGRLPKEPEREVAYPEGAMSMPPQVLATQP